jgi:alkanesulfonate monooxygenase SsuD/methylene tetrahydromethanopterin reductase-like flavin-dependent oxidoreductase (luciferase family)
MRFGTFSYNQARPWVPERQAFEELLEQIQLTERLGFDEAWFAEHHHSDYGMLASPNLDYRLSRSPHPAPAPREPGQCPATP